MKEFGSDFHFIEPDVAYGNILQNFYPKVNYYADGRQTLIHLYKSQGWKRLWVPEYYCYDVIKSLKDAGIKIMFYTDFPGFHQDNETLETIQRNGYFKSSDAVLRVNYFGTRAYRSSEKLLAVTIIEDHTHDLIGDWAMNSDADWCIASLRKTLPIPEGGILWSPKGFSLPKEPSTLNENEEIASMRWNAMALKSLYIAGEDTEKSTFRSGFVSTEAFFDSCEVCALDKKSREYLSTFDIYSWYQRKNDNWKLLKDIKSPNVHVMFPENSECYPFSLILMFDSINRRDKIREALIDNSVYPAILWNIPSPCDSDVFSISHSMLSIHCDARYSGDDIHQLKLIIQKVLSL